MHRCLHMPSQIREVAHRIDAELSLGEIGAPGGDRSAYVGGEPFAFPYRVYYTPQRIASVTSRLEGDARVFALCLISRHHDGQVREAAVRNSHFVERPWSTPFAVQLLGEYVVEIGRAVEDQISTLGVRPFVNFARENPNFMETTRRRAISYWDCYYRNVYKTLEEYPCFRALQTIRTASGEA